ncbi:MAG TPA: hypothetical protein PKK26_16765, partial [Candidatus Wallbacteria bacterium]|nr:hypothetical protein [Candidatus Wallbacteria bacterium]
DWNMDGKMHLIRAAYDALRADREAPAGTFHIRTKKSKLKLQQDYYVAVLVTLLIFAIGIGGGIFAFYKSSAVSGAIIAAIFSFCGALSWWLWVGTAAEVIADPWYRSMICTGDHLLIRDMGNCWLVPLKGYDTVTIIAKNQKGWITYHLAIDGPSEKFFLGDYGHFGVEELKTFADSLQARLSSISQAIL